MLVDDAPAGGRHRKDIALCRDQEDRHRRRYGPCDRSWRGHPRAVDSDDGLQHGNRGAPVAIDDKTTILRGRPLAPTRRTGSRSSMARASDEGARFNTVVVLDAAALSPQVTWGTSPEMVVSIDGRVPDPDKEKDAARRDGIERALAYMGLTPNTAMTDIGIDKVFIGSCTNSRIEDLRAAARVARGRRVASSVKLALVVPGSGLVKAQAEREGLDKVFRDAASTGASPGARCPRIHPDPRL